MVVAQRPSVAARVAARGEVGGGGEVGAVAGFGCGPAEPDSQVGLPDTWRPDEQDVGRGVEVAAGGELVDQLAVESGGGVEVEVRQRGRGRQRREPQAAGELAGVGSLDLAGQQVLQRRGHRPLLGFGLGEHARQVLGGSGELQRGEVAT
jgi:hypothetical protein